MQQKLQRLTRRCHALLSSRAFFVALLIFFVFEAVWIAISARYPMAFDEDFHFGIIKLYEANNFSPFLFDHPANGDAFGAVARDPSYLYHYLMSFPYKLIALFTGSQTVQIIVLRLMNVAFVAGGIVAFRRLLLRAKLSRALTHVVLAIFTLVPIVPLLAGQVNYDNLLLLLVPLTLLLAMNILEGLRRREVNVGQTGLLVSLLLLESVVKYPFLPIALSIAGFVLYRLVRTFWGKYSAFWEACRKGFRKLSRRAGAALAVLFVLSAGLFFERYGINILHYQTPLPDCGQVLSEEQCQSYGPWARNQLYESQKTEVNSNLFSYANLWFHDMLLRSVFAINGPFSEYTNHFPLWIPQAVFEFMCLVSVVLFLFFAARILRGRWELQFFLLIFGVYIGVLFWNNYGGYLQTGQPVAINGRYLLLILPLVLAIAALAFVYFLRKIRVKHAQSWVAVGIILLLLQGGGFVTFVLQSDESWYWQNNRLVGALNDTAKNVLRPLVYEKPAERFLKYQ